MTANQPGQVRVHPALSALLGQWRGSTRVAAGPWGPASNVEAEVSYTPVAGGLGVVQSYNHAEPDGGHFEGHGIFTVDPVHQDVLWYYIDSTGAGPGIAARCTWHDGILRVERHSDGGWTRHSIWVEDDVLTHITELRSVVAGDGGDAHSPGTVVGKGAETDGKGQSYRPFLHSVFRRV